MGKHPIVTALVKTIIVSLILWVVEVGHEVHAEVEALTCSDRFVCWLHRWISALPYGILNYLASRFVHIIAKGQHAVKLRFSLWILEDVIRVSKICFLELLDYRHLTWFTVLTCYWSSFIPFISGTIVLVVRQACFLVSSRLFFVLFLTEFILKPCHRTYLIAVVISTELVRPSWSWSRTPIHHVL
jgi:hypothetical protein